MTAHILYSKIDNENVALNVLVGFCTFYIAYSTWDGRFLYADQIQPESDGSLKLYRFMAQVSQAIGCTRLTWKVSC